LDARQIEELFLTSAQSLFALALISNFDLSVRESTFLLVTFLAQLFFPQQGIRILFAIVYVVAALGMVIFVRSRRETIMQIPAMLRETVGWAPTQV